jgi:hypothetical protein
LRRLRKLVCAPGHLRLEAAKKDVDARVKRVHDEKGIIDRHVGVRASLKLVDITTSTVTFRIDPSDVSAPGPKPCARHLDKISSMQ